jgi:hypothetical protein
VAAWDGNGAVNEADNTIFLQSGRAFREPLSDNRPFAPSGDLSRAQQVLSDTRLSKAALRWRIECPVDVA